MKMSNSEAATQAAVPLTMSMAMNPCKYHRCFQKVPLDCCKKQDHEMPNADFYE